jgi:hypothetical protein
MHIGLAIIPLGHSSPLAAAEIHPSRPPQRLSDSLYAPLVGKREGRGPEGSRPSLSPDLSLMLVVILLLLLLLVVVLLHFAAARHCSEHNP